MDKNPFPSVGWMFCALGASLSTQGMVGQLDGPGDAMRHALWAACMLKILGAKAAATILANHEDGKNDPYDKNNNAVGVAIGQSRIQVSLVKQGRVEKVAKARAAKAEVEWIVLVQVISQGVKILVGQMLEKIMVAVLLVPF